MKMQFHQTSGSSRLPAPMRDPNQDPWSFENRGTSGANAAPPPWSSYWQSLLRARWYLIAGVVLTTVAAFIYAGSIVPVHRSTATILIEAGKAKILSIEEVYNAMSQDREYYQTQVEILRSRDVALRTVVATKLWNEPEFDPRRPRTGLVARIKSWFRKEAPPVVWTPQALADATVGKFMSVVNIEPVRLSQLVRISFEAEDPVLAARMANATATSYIQADSDARSKLQFDVNLQLQERLTALRDKLLQSEQALQAYREKEGLVNISGQQGVAGQQLSEISLRLVTARVHRTELESTFRQYLKASESSSGDVPSSMNAPGLAEARRRVALAAAKVEDESRTLGDRHTRVIEAKAELEAAQRDARAEMRAAVESARAALSAARETERSLEAALASARAAVQGVNRQEFQLGVLEREVQANRQIYEIFLSRTKETGVSTNLQVAVARIVDPAAPALTPVRPNKPQIIGLTLLLTLLAGSAVAVLSDVLRRTIRDTGDAEQRLRHPVLASVPSVRSSAKIALTRSVVDRPYSRHAAAIRTARTGILLAGFDPAHNVVLVTSTMRGEGRTTLCTNLALAHSQSKRTLLLECDFRNPSIAVRLGLPPQAKGLTDLVWAGAPVSECLHDVPGSSLMVMPAGTIRPNPDELLLSRAFQDTLKSLAYRVDVVIIDAPALDSGSDALLLAQYVNDTIYVVKAGSTPRQRALKGIEQLKRAGANILGLVLNDLESAGEDMPDMPDVMSDPRPMARSGDSPATTVVEPHSTHQDAVKATPA